MDKKIETNKHKSNLMDSKLGEGTKQITKRMDKKLDEMDKKIDTDKHRSYLVDHKPGEGKTKITKKNPQRRNLGKSSYCTVSDGDLLGKKKQPKEPNISGHPHGRKLPNRDAGVKKNYKTLDRAALHQCAGAHKCSAMETHPCDKNEEEANLKAAKQATPQGDLEHHKLIAVDDNHVGTAKHCGKQCYRCFSKYPQLPKQRQILPHSCDHCYKRFSYKMDMDLHIRQHHTRPNLPNEHHWRCFDRPVTSKDSTLLELFHCKECNDPFRSWNDLSKHMIIHQNDMLYMCGFCAQKFYDVSKLVKHVRFHESSTYKKSADRYRCGLCWVAYSELNDLRDHSVEYHANESFLTCFPPCGRQFKTVSKKARHEMHLLRDTYYICPHCKKEFVLRKDLDLHLYLHTNSSWLET